MQSYRYRTGTEMYRPARSGTRVRMSHLLRNRPLILLFVILCFKVCFFVRFRFSQCNKYEYEYRVR